MRPIITVTAVVLVHLCVIAVLVGVNGCRSTSGFEQPGDTAAFSAGARPTTGRASSTVVPVPAPGNLSAIPAPVPTKAAPIRAVGPGGKRTVLKGETLTSVSLHEKVSRADLAKANGLALNALLKEGQVLTIPSASAKVAPKAVVNAAPQATPTAAPAPTFAPMKIVPVTGTKPAPVVPEKK